MKGKLDQRMAQDDKSGIESKQQKSNYVPIKQIGKGAYANVVLEQKDSELRVAKIFIDVARSTTAVDINNEAKLLSQLSHPHIVKYLDHTLSPQKIIYFEYAKHGSLHHYIKSRTQMEWEKFGYKCAYQISCAIAYLHANEIVHRDVKPDNILLMADYTAKLCDFGYAGKLSEINRRQFIGTGLFLAQEVIQEKKYAYKIDCYAFGITLFEMSTMSDTWPNKSLKEIFAAVIKGEVQELPQETPTLIKEIYQGCTLYSPRKRPSAQEISDRFTKEQPEEKNSLGIDPTKQPMLGQNDPTYFAVCRLGH